MRRPLLIPAVGLSREFNTKHGAGLFLLGNRVLIGNITHPVFNHVLFPSMKGNDTRHHHQKAKTCNATASENLCHNALRINI